jgi:hypothetical protein
MNRIGATVRAIEEQSAVAKAVKDMKPPYT